MSPTFVPPRPDQWQGPAQTSTQSAAGFVPPPPSSWQGPATGLPSFPKGNKPATLPDVTNDDLKRWGRSALNYAPAIGATAAALTQPEFIPAIGAAMLGGAGGSAVKQGVLAATGQPDAPKSMGQAAGEVGKDALTQGALEAGGRALAKPIEFVGQRMFSPSRMYQSALKPSVALDKSIPSSVADMEARKRVATGLSEGVPTNESGYDMTRGKIDDLNSQISGLVKGSANSKTPLINPADVAQRLDSLEQFYKGQALPAADVAEIQNARRQYLTKHGAQFDNTGNMTQPPSLMTPIEAQTEKQATYAVNRKKYGQLTNASDESEKALARGLKEELVKVYPELSDLNAQDSALYGLEQSLRRFINREANKNLVGLIPAILGTGAGIVVGHGGEGAMGGSMLGAAMMALDSPTVKSNLAIALNRASQSRLGRVLSNVTPSRALPAAGRLIQGAAAPQPQQPGIPQFAKGGIATKPTVGLIAEKEPEAVVPTRLLNASTEGRRILGSLPSSRAAQMGDYYSRRSARTRPVVKNP